MFFIMGVTQGRKEFGFAQRMICAKCGRSGSYIVFMTYSVLTLFFIPVFKWNRQYFVRTSCCGTVYLLDPEVGRIVARGGQVDIRPQDLQEVSAGWAGAASGQQSFQEGVWQNGAGADSGAGANTNPWTNEPAAPAAKKTCGNCGYEAEPDFEYCPKCGNKL